MDTTKEDTDKVLKRKVQTEEYDKGTNRVTIKKATGYDKERYRV